MRKAGTIYILIGVKDSHLLVQVFVKSIKKTYQLNWKLGIGYRKCQIFIPLRIDIFFYNTGLQSLQQIKMEEY